MKTICGWCVLYFKRTPVVLVDGPDDGEVSHGICPECLKRWKGKA